VPARRHGPYQSQISRWACLDAGISLGLGCNDLGDYAVASLPSRDVQIVLAGVTLEDRLPPNEYLEYYGPDFRLQPSVPQDKPNQNSPEYLEEVLFITFLLKSVGHGAVLRKLSRLCQAHSQRTHHMKTMCRVRHRRKALCWWSAHAACICGSPVEKFTLMRCS